MMLIFFYGNYHWGKKGRVFDRAYCSICGQRNRPICSYSAWEVGHAMFIPLIPWGKIRVVGHCLTCKRCYKFSLNGRRLNTAISEQRATAFARMGQGTNQTLADLAGLAYLGDFEGAQSFLDELAIQDGVGHAIATARFQELQGDADKAESAFLNALQADPASGTPNYWFGRFLLIQGRDEEAIMQFRRSAELNPYQQYLDLLTDFVQVRKQRKQWDGLAIIMAEMAHRKPENLNDRRFVRLYSMACQKSGRNVAPPMLR